MDKPCDMCGTGSRVPKERYCKECRKQVLAPIRDEYKELEKVRTLSRTFSEMVGRPALGVHFEDRTD
jgi:hypothetical protein